MDGSKFREVIRTLLLEEIARVVQTKEDPARARRGTLAPLFIDPLNSLAGKAGPPT